MTDDDGDALVQAGDYIFVELGDKGLVMGLNQEVNLHPGMKTTRKQYENLFRGHPHVIALYRVERIF